MLLNRGRRWWILSAQVAGSLWLDDGACAAVGSQHTSLFAAGIVRVNGSFGTHEAVSICDASGREFGRGLVNYSSQDLFQIKARERILVYGDRDAACLITHCHFKAVRIGASVLWFHDRWSHGR